MPKHTLSKLPLPARTSIALGVTFLFAFLGCLAFAATAQASEDPSANLSMYGKIVFALSMLLCGFTGAKLGSESRFTDGMLGVGVMLLFVIALSLAFGGTGFVKGILLVLLGAFMGAGGSLFGAKKTKRRKR